MNLSVQASRLSGVGGVVNVSDANAESVIVNNASSASNAAVSFTLSANGKYMQIWPVVQRSAQLFH